MRLFTIKNVAFAAVLLATNTVFGQQFFKETFDVTTNKTAISAYTSPNAGISITVNTDKIDLRTTGLQGASAKSGNYEGSTPVANVWFPAAGEKELIISGINTSGKSNIQMTFGATTNKVGQDPFLTVSYSTDGTNYTALTLTNAPNKNEDTYFWRLVTVNETLPATDNLYLKFSAPEWGDSQSGYGARIDDVMLSEGNGSSIEANVIETPAAYAADGVVYVPANAGEKIVVSNVAGQTIAVVTAEEGVTAINNLPANQILLVKAGNKVSKVIF